MAIILSTTVLSSELALYANPLDSRSVQEADSSYRAKQQPLTFVLVHGSWADTSFWAGIASELSKKGHTVYVPEYPGHGADPNKNVTHTMMSKSIVDFIISHKLHNVILVAHSFGGTLIQKVAELVPDRLKPSLPTSYMKPPETNSVGLGSASRCSSLWISLQPVQNII